MQKPKSPPSPREVFGRNVRFTRRLNDISEEELAQRADLSRNYLSDVESGVRNVSIDNMGLLAQALSMQLHDLLKPVMFGALGEFSA